MQEEPDGMLPGCRVSARSHGTMHLHLNMRADDMCMESKEKLHVLHASLQASCEEDCASAQGRIQHIFSYCDGCDWIWI